MNKLTVGYVEDILRKHNKSTEIHTVCNCCHHGALGSTNILKIKDNTNQTYGYIEFELNASSDPIKVELTDNEKEFYEGELKRLNEENEKLKRKLKIYNEYIEDIECSINRHTDMVKTRLEWEDEK